MNRHALVTGGAGFIGSHLVDRLLDEGWRVTVVDDLNAFYSPALKLRNTLRHRQFDSYTLNTIDIRDLDDLRAVRGDFDVVLHLAARAGVRPSIDEPISYQEVNVGGTHNLLELARERGVNQFVFASSSSVYGVNENVPWREDDHVLLPISPYAATKVSGELLGHVYSKLFGVRFLALRLFTVYGPRQRPDLAINTFVRRIIAGEPVTLFGNGGTRRDYTYVGDIVSGLRHAVEYSDSLYEVINLGNNRTISLLEMVGVIEETLGRNATIEFAPEQAGDVPQTWADISKAGSLLGYAPATDFRSGIANFVDWYREVEAEHLLAAVR